MSTKPDLAQDCDALVAELARAGRVAQRALARMSDADKADALRSAAGALRKAAPQVLAANARDIAADARPVAARRPAARGDCRRA
jgi:glutamate-5-semialdehyde dehydrogenase